MIMTVINALFAVLISCAVLLYVKYDNAFYLTIRGKRFLFVVGILFFFGLLNVSQNLYFDCDLRNLNNIEKCEVHWGLPY
jgi:bacteriorhodopsin